MGRLSPLSTDPLLEPDRNRRAGPNLFGAIIMMSVISIGKNGLEAAVAPKNIIGCTQNVNLNRRKSLAEIKRFSLESKWPGR